MIKSRHLIVLMLGILTTLLVAGAWYKGWGEFIELFSLDRRFRLAPSREIQDDLVHVDIDDGSIDEVGRWPWPRKKLAGIVTTLKSAGAEKVALDILFPEPQKIRYVSQSQNVYGAFGQVLHEGKPKPQMDDAIFSKSLNQAGNVVLAMHMDFNKKGMIPFEKEIEKLLQQKPNISFRQLCLDIASVDPEINSSKKSDMLHYAYLNVRGRQALAEFSRGKLNAKSAKTTAPLVTLTQNAFDIGFATVKPDDDGIVRKMRMLGNDRDKTYLQFGLTLVVDKLQNKYDKPLRIKNKNEEVLIVCDNEIIRRINTDDDNLLINWTLGTGRDISSKHHHIPAKAVVKIYDEKQRLKKLESFEYGLKVKWISLVRQISDPQVDKLYWEFADLTNKFDEIYLKRIKLQRQEYFNRLYSPAEASLEPQIEKLTSLEKNTESKLHKLADELYRSCLADKEAFIGKEGDFKQRLKKADEIEKMLAQIPSDRDDLKTNIAKLENELRQMVQGKICLVGSTATAAADFVPTPLNKRTPGVAVHAGVYDTIISDNFIKPAGLLVNLCVIAAAGLIMTFLAMRFNAPVSGPIGLALGIIYVYYNTFIVFSAWNVNLVVIAPLVSMLSVFIVITAYREITEERAKRKIKGMFSKALSASLVDELLENPALANLGGQQRELTCMFSDIAGFTPLSQRIGPQKMVKLLNTYFDCVTEVVQTRFGGYINKFLGDGIFALFGAPVLQDDHAKLAVRSAVEYVHAVELLNKDITDADLTIRIGINAGNAIVGNCGSSTRMDYTAIGDCVNLAARLEAANKYFQTNILIEKETWQKADLESEMISRPVGLANITGVSQPVWLIQVAGDIQGNKPLSEQYQIFTHAMELLYDYKYEAAVEIFEQVERELDQDFVTKLYLDIAKQGMAGKSYQSAIAPQNKYSGGVVTIVPPWEL